MKYRANLIIVGERMEVCKVSLFIREQHVVSIMLDSSNNIHDVIKCTGSLIHCFYSTYLDITGKFQEEYYDVILKRYVYVAYDKFLKLIMGK